MYGNTARVTRGYTQPFNWIGGPKRRLHYLKAIVFTLHGKFFAYSTESLYESSYEAYRLRQGVAGSLSPYAKLVDQKPSQYELPPDEKIKSYIWNRPKTY